MALHCPRCERKLADSADAADQPLFCMFCGQKLRSGDQDQTLPPVVMPDPPSVVPDEDEAVTRSIASPTASTAVETESAPARVAGFRLLRFIGAGGMGTVYEAEADHTGQKVAVKLLARRLASNPASVERFRQEGRLASQISHPRCVFVLRADTDAGRPFIVMELMPGRTLKDVVDESGPMKVEVAVGHILDVIDGLIEAHRLGVIHRDVKPSNCFLTDDGRVKVGDFGLSKSLGPDGANPKQLTGSGAFLGTVLFASPEQIRGEPVGYDSDVYAVSATLYYLLAGRAPHQHDSLTAALAKAISEPPPPIRERRPDVTAELERAVLRGLDRDRTRRFQALEELRDALVSVLPARQVPARPRSLFLAYLIDTLLLQLAVIPAEVLHQTMRSPGSVKVTLFDMSWVGGLITAAYFILMEGRLGSTLGKRSMRLRVVKLGETGPPGLRAATVRTGLYTAVWLFMATLPGILAEQVGGWFAGVSGLTFFAVGLTVLCRQLWRSKHGYRGVHDYASGTRTVQLPRPPARLRLVSHFPNPLDQPVKADRAAPEAIGGFAVGGLICRVGDGSELWSGEDRSLGRRVLIRVEPAGAAGYDFDSLPEPRAHRLRVVGYGVTAWGAATRPWIAYVAPAGAPLPDVVSPATPLGWAESRPVLEQVVAELVAAEAEDAEPGPLSPEQIWVEPNGRVQVLDFPLPTGRELAEDRTKSRYPVGISAPFDSVRAVATLLLEGAARTTGGRVTAPLPPHASAITDRLMTDDRTGYTSLARLGRDLAENHSLPPQVTGGLRAGHLTLQALLCAVGLLAMFLLAGGYSFFLAWGTHETARLPRRVKEAMADPARRAAALAALATDANVEPKVRASVMRSLADDRWPQTERKLDQWAAAWEEHLAAGDLYLNEWERSLLSRLREAEPDASEVPGSRALQYALTAAELPSPPTPNIREEQRFWPVTLVVASFPLVIWPLFAAIFRGGLSMLVTGIAVVTQDGLPAARWRCAVREALGWTPLLAVLLASAWIQFAAPQLVFARTFLWLLAFVVLLLSVGVAVRDPARGPHDRIMGTYLVPR